MCVVEDEEIAWTQIQQALDARFKRKRAAKVFRDFRAAEDPEAPTTVLGRKRFTYQAAPKKLAAMLELPSGGR